jgi:hypothetical protein
MVASRSLRLYFTIEARAGALRGPLVGLMAGAAMIAVTHLVVPRLPPTAISVLEKSFAIQGPAALLLINDYLALYAALFFAGFAELLRALVAPREERHLELLLSKPLSPSTFVRARAAPVLAAVGLAAAALGAGLSIAIAPVSSPASATAAGAFGASIVIGSAVVAQLAALSPLLVRSRDGFEALIVGFVVWVAPLLPATAFLYRPDLFEGRPALASALVLPANLIWHDASMPMLALLAMGLAAALAALLLAWAGRVLRRTGVG